MKTPNHIREIINEIDAATAASKCHKCGCFHGALKQLRQVLPTLSNDGQNGIRAALEAGAGRVIAEEYACLGCPVCWPANALNLAAQAFPEAVLESESACPTEVPDPDRRWPPLPGNYHVLDTAGTVAVCVLTSEQLSDAVAAARPDRVAIIGTLFTENLGIERLVVNTLANPNLTTLFLCGEDSQQRIGHRPGQTLISLIANGIDERQRVVGAEGRRPILKNISMEVVSAFRHEIAVIDHIGVVDPIAILNLLKSSANQRSTRRVFSGDGQTPLPIRAQPPERLTLDPKGYFVIFPDRARRMIRLEHYETSGVLAHVFEGVNAGELYSTVLAHDLLSRLDHAAYLGKELALAERAVRAGEAYVQDRAPEPSCGQGCGCS